MVVCKYFQQGYCRYGQNCRFEHVYGSKYSYHATPPAPQPTNQGGVTDEQLVNQVQMDVQAAVKGGQWLLSSYAPFKEKPNMPGISDLSPEEARLFIYEAKANNTMDQAVGYMNNLMKDMRYKYEQLLQPTQAIIKVFRCLYKGEVPASPFSSASSNAGFGSSANNAASSIFRSATQNMSAFGQSNANTTPSVFGQSNTNNTPSIFNQNTSPASVFGQNNVFGAQSPDTAKSIFAQATQNTFASPPANQNVFGNQNADVAAKSIFAQATQNAFGSQAQPSAPSSIFASASQQMFGQSAPQSSPFATQSAPSNVFQQSPKPSIFGQTNIFEQSTDVGMYSKMEDLSAEDKLAFESNEFKLGFVPEVPPPQSLCI